MPDAAPETLPTRFSIALPQADLAPLPAELPDDVNALKALLQAQQASHQQALEQAIAQLHQQAEQRIAFLYEQFTLFRRRMFGSSSEALPGQQRLFDEAEVLAGQPDPQDEEAADTPEAGPQPAKPKARGKRAPLPAELPRVEIVHDLPEADRMCPCGTPMVVIGQDVSEQLDIVPMKIQVLRHIRLKYGCPGGEHAPQTAPMPAQPLPKSNASPELLAMLLTVKYADGLPLARFEKVLQRHGVDVPRQTLARWAIDSAQLLQPLANLARDRLFEIDLMHMDETVVQVLKEPDRAAQAKSYMWVQTGGPPDKPVVLFDYDPSRSAQVPRRLLAGFSGWLMTDGYDGYNPVTQDGDIQRLGCWAHVRRKLMDAKRVQGKGKIGRADQALEMIGELYKVEREAHGLTDAQRLELRTKRSVPMLKKIHEWLLATHDAVLPSSVLGKALRYLAGQWPRLEHYATRGDLPIDNNRAENAIRPFVIGRRAWLFSATPAGAHASALVYSMIETARANGVEPYAWLAHVMRSIRPDLTPDDYEALMPWNFHPV